MVDRQLWNNKVKTNTYIYNSHYNMLLALASTCDIQLKSQRPKKKHRKPIRRPLRKQTRETRSGSGEREALAAVYTLIKNTLPDTRTPTLLQRYPWRR